MIVSCLPRQRGREIFGMLLEIPVVSLVPSRTRGYVRSRWCSIELGPGQMLVSEIFLFGAILAVPFGERFTHLTTSTCRCADRNTYLGMDVFRIMKRISEILCRMHTSYFHAPTSVSSLSYCYKETHGDLRSIMSLFSVVTDKERIIQLNKLRVSVRTRNRTDFGNASSRSLFTTSHNST